MVGQCDRIWVSRKPWIRVWRADGTYALLPIPDEDHERLARLDGKKLYNSIGDARPS